MREQFADTVDIHNRSAVRIIDGSLNFVLFDVLADHACQLVVDFMSRTGSDYAAPDRFADQCQVTDHIDQLVACRLVVEYQRFIVDVAQVLYVLMRDRQLVGKIVEHLLRYFLVIDDDRIVEVTTFDQVILQQHLYFANKHECAGSSQFCREFTQVVQRGELVGKHRRIEGNQNIDAKLVVRQDNEGRTSFFILDFDLMLYDIVIFRCVLFHDTGFLNLFTEKTGTAVENREFGCIHLYQAVIYFVGI